MKLGRHQEAIQPLQKLLAIEPKHVSGNHALGMAYARLGDKLGAMQQYYILANDRRPDCCGFAVGVPK